MLLTTRVCRALLHSIAKERPGLGAVAARLGLTARTLQRRLAAEGTTFQAVLDTVRAELSRHYLERSTYSVSEIAFLLGFEEPASFTRAVRGWHGRSSAAPGRTETVDVAVDGVTYRLNVFNASYRNNESTIQDTPWWGNGDLAQSVATKVQSDFGTLEGTFNFFAYGENSENSSLLDTYRIAASGTIASSPATFTENSYVLGSEVGPPPVPEIDGAVLAQLALVLGTLWLVFGAGRRGDDETRVT